MDLRDLDSAELDAVSGGNVLKPISDAIAAGVKAGAQWLADHKPFPISYDPSGAANAGKQLGAIVGNRT